jgi:hypothetical protein
VNPDPAAVAAELEAAKARISALERALAPAFPAPQQRAEPYWTPQNWCGEGTCRPSTPCARCQGAAPGAVSPKKTSDPWREDIEHTEAFMARANDAAPLIELRRQAADDEAMRAARRAEQSGPRELWGAPVWGRCRQPSCRPATPCPACAGQPAQPVADQSGDRFGGHRQVSHTHEAVPELGVETSREPGIWR